MKILAFDTCMQSCSVAVQLDDKLFSRNLILERGHAEKLMPMIADILHEAETDIKTIERIAVTRGPGSFTGVRIGVAAARGLALATGIELVATSTLHVLAAKAFTTQPSLAGSIVCVAIDARRDQIYLGLFDENGPLTPDPHILHPRDAGDLFPKGEKMVVIGSGRQLLLEALAPLFISQLVMPPNSNELPNPQPDAAVLAQLADTLPVISSTLSPLYLRSADAKTQSGYAIKRR